MSIQRKLYLDRIGKIEESIVKGTKRQDEPFTVVAIKNNKVVDQFAGAEYKELGEIIKYVKSTNKGAKISVEGKGGKVVHTEEVEQVDEASVYKRPAKISALGGQKNHAIVDSKGNIIHIGMSEKDARKIRQFGQKVMELPGARVGQKIKEDVEVNEETYDEFFAKAMKKFGISSPADLKNDKKKKEFFDYVDKNYKSDVEKATGKDDPDADDEEKVAREKADKKDKK